jgi:hypothetical protein
VKKLAVPMSKYVCGVLTLLALHQCAAASTAARPTGSSGQSGPSLFSLASVPNERASLSTEGLVLDGGAAPAWCAHVRPANRKLAGLCARASRENERQQARPAHRRRARALRHVLRSVVEARDLPEGAEGPDVHAEVQSERGAVVPRGATMFRARRSAVAAAPRHVAVAAGLGVVAAGVGGAVALDGGDILSAVGVLAEGGSTASSEGGGVAEAPSSEWSWWFEFEHSSYFWIVVVIVGVVVVLCVTGCCCWCCHRKQIRLRGLEIIGGRIRRAFQPDQPTPAGAAKCPAKCGCGAAGGAKCPAKCGCAAAKGAKAAPGGGANGVQSVLEPRPNQIDAMV